MGIDARRDCEEQQSARYTLDLVDAGHGGWGWLNLDSVTIPGVLFSPSNPPAAAQTLLAKIHVRLAISGTSNFTYHVQATTNLADLTTLLTTNAPPLPLN